jgi:hypothetical protein
VIEVVRTLVGPAPGAGTEDDNAEFLGEASVRD